MVFFSAHNIEFDASYEPARFGPLTSMPLLNPSHHRLFSSRLWREALKQSAIDPATGRVDVAILASGMSSSGRKAVEAMCEVILKQLKTAKGFVTSKALFQTLKAADKTCTKEVFDEALNELAKKETIARSGERVRFQAVDA